MVVDVFVHAMARYMTARDAAKFGSARDAVALRAFDTVVEMVQRKIRMAGNVGHSDVMFEVPVWLCDAPAYDREEMAYALYTHFRKHGFWVELCGSILYLSWRYVT